mmetsp:Transcript_24685/g.59527  ORF Transcript_24685/g.59527 Transcript_24685/m.59527 type:complete len:283 (-) Transcript_24685:120-968(-)
MAPIVGPCTVSCEADDESNFTVNGNGTALAKAKLDGSAHCIDVPLTISDGRDDDDNDVAAQSGDEDPSKLFHESNVDRRQSNLFADETKVNEFPSIPVSSYLGNYEDAEVVEPPECAPVLGLSLMQSFSPSSTTSLGGLVDADSGTQAFDDFAVDIMSQIDADEALAWLLQEEENKKKKLTLKAKPKPRVRPTFVDSLLGEPLTWEVKSGNYARVSNDSGSGGDFSVSSGISIMTNSFRRWGSDISAAATDFFGEDVGMQIRSSSSRRSEGPGQDGEYRNAV